MYAKKEEDEAGSSRAMNNIQNYRNNLFFHQLIFHHHHDPDSSRGSGFSIFSQDSVSPTWSSPIQPPSPAGSFYGSFFNRSQAHQGLQFGYGGFGGATSASHHHNEQLRILSEALLGPVVQASSGPFGLQAELGKMTSQEIMDAKALAASKSHSEAERRPRERINNHFAKLRSLPNTTKTDKASLLAEVIQQVKELRRETSLIAEASLIPTESNELTVAFTEEEETGDGRFVIKASLCCEDRSDLLQDMIKTLKAMRLKTLKAEITTVGGRIKNVLFATGEESSVEEEYSLEKIEEALKAVMEKNNVEYSSSYGKAKRHRMISHNTISIIEQQRHM